MPALQRVEMKSRKGRLTYGVIMTILCVGIPMQVFPYIWILLSMFKANKEVRAIPPTFFPNKWLWENIPQTFAKYHLEQNILNSLLLCVGVILIQVTISTLAAYALSKLKPKGSKWVMTFFLGTMMINSQALAWPTYIMFTNFFGVRMIDNLWSLILSFSAWAWAIFILFRGPAAGSAGIRSHRRRQQCPRALVDHHAVVQTGLFGCDPQYLHGLL